MPREQTQARLGDLPLKRRDAQQMVDDFVLEHLGSIPVSGNVTETDETFTFEIRASFPRVILDEITGEPSKTRFIEIGKVGEVIVDRVRGKIVEKPTFYEVQGAIRERLSFISESVEKALVRVAANEFSRLPFPVHLHTPVVDVLSWLLIKGSLRLAELEEFPEPAAKLLPTIEPLQKVRLIDIQEDTVVPGPVLIGIEQKFHKTDEQLSMGLAHFFREGYSFIESIRQVLGPHLALSSIVYERAVESDGPVPLTLPQIEQDFNRFYPTERLLKLPRYLVQLEAIGVAEKEVRSGIAMWRGVAGIYGELKGEDLLEPVGRMIA